jgi:hypothetical protein
MWSDEATSCMHEFARHALMAYGQEPRTVCF